MIPGCNLTLEQEKALWSDFYSAAQRVRIPDAIKRAQHEITKAQHRLLHNPANAVRQMALASAVAALAHIKETHNG